MGTIAGAAVGAGSLVMGAINSGSSSDNSAGSTASTNTSAATNLGIDSYLSGEQDLTQYQDLLDQAMGTYGQQLGMYTGEQGNVDNSLENAATGQNNEISSEAAAYTPYADEAAATGQNALGYLNNQIALANNTASEKEQATQDTSNALNTDMSLYQPEQAKTIGEMGSVLEPAAQTALTASQVAGETAMNTYSNPEQFAARAGADVDNSFQGQQTALNMQNASLGISPDSGAAQNADIDLATNAALSRAGAETQGLQTATNQNIADQQIGTNELNSGVNTMDSTLSNINTQLSKGPEDAGMGIFSSLSNFNPTEATSMMLPQDTSTSGDSSLESWNANPTMPNYSTEANLGESEEQPLFNVLGNYGSQYDTLNGQDMQANEANASGSGKLTGLGLTSLMGNGNNGGSLSKIFSSSGSSSGGGDAEPGDEDYDL
jgi:hypothetical protein